MNPRDVLAHQQLLRDNLTKPAYASFLQHFADDVNRKGGGLPLITDEKGKPSGALMANQQRLLLEFAEAYAVTADMTQVARFASTGLDSLDRFSHDLWPSEVGFLWFEQAVEDTDVWGKSMIIQALSWGRRSYSGHPGTLVFLYADMDHPHDPLGQSMSEQERNQVGADFGRIHLVHTMWLADGQRVGPPTTKPPQDYAENGGKDDVLAESVTNPNRLILALLMLLGQTITVTTRHDLRPTNPKRARKMKVPGQVTVVTLRHAKGTQRQEGETQVEWQHRWLVKGHWRSQVCGPHYPLAQEIAPGQYRARIYIAPFVKGPEDAPFAQSTKVYHLAR